MPHYPEQTRYKHSTPYGQRGFNGVYYFHRTSATQPSRASVTPQASVAPAPKIQQSFDTLELSQPARASSPGIDNYLTDELKSKIEEAATTKEFKNPTTTQAILDVQRAAADYQAAGGSQKFFHKAASVARKTNGLSTQEKQKAKNWFFNLNPEVKEKRSAHDANNPNRKHRKKSAQ